MALDSGLFLAVTCAAGLVAYIVPQRFRYAWLLVCSYAFYCWACRGLPLQMPSTLQQLGLGTELPAFVPALLVLLFATFAGWLCGLFIGRATHKAAKALFLALAVASCVGIWAACRHLDLFSYFRLHVGGIVTETKDDTVHLLALPLGLSYFTFQSLGYAIDVAAKRTQVEKNPLRYAAFISFFPGIPLGPINRAGQMLPQLKNPAPFNYNTVAGGLFRVLWGFFKKMVVADNIAPFTRHILGAAGLSTGPLLVCAILLFAYQLYADFSGCCDIAIGAARMMGFTFAENFKRPFASKSFAGLMQRWFMSLTGLLRDAVFSPLAQSRWTQKLPGIGKFFKNPPVYTAAVLTYMLFALWHGISTDYLLWGAGICLIMVVGRLTLPLRNRAASAVPLYKKPAVRGVFQRIIVYLLFAACLMPFLSALFEQPFLEWVSHLGWGWGMVASGELLPALARAGLSLQRAGGLALGILLIEIVEKLAVSTESTVADWIRTRPFYIRWPLYYGLLAALILLGVYGSAFGGTPSLYQPF